MLNQINDRRVEQLAKLLIALAHPIRMQIVLGLTRSTSVSALRQYLQISQIDLSHHLTQMQNGGLLNSEPRDGEIFYSLKDTSLNKAVELLLIN